MASPMDFYAFREKAIQQGGQVRDAQSMAEMGAARLEQYGPQGAEWASRLRADPRAALAMAQQYGGFQQIEQQLQRAGSAGSAAAARQMSPMAMQAWVQGGPQGLQQYMASQADSGKARVLESRADIMERMMGGGGMAASGAGVGPMGPSDQLITAMIASGQIQEAEKLLTFRRDKRKSWSDQVSDFQALNKSLVQSGMKQLENWADFRSRDFTNPVNDAALVKQYIQSVEPGLAVTGGEAEAVAKVAQSFAENTGVQLANLLDASGAFTAEGRKRIVSAIDTAFTTRAKVNLRALDSNMEEARGAFAGTGEEERLMSRAFIGDDGFRSLAEEMLGQGWKPKFRSPDIDATREAMASAKPGDKVRDHEGQLWERTETGFKTVEE